MKSSSPRLSSVARAYRRFRGEHGGAAVEFGILAPLLGLILAGVIDLGGAVLFKYRLDNFVSSAANYAMLSGASINSSDGANLASAIATIVTNSGGNSDVSGTVVVNNGPTATIEYGRVSLGGTAANADKCYCPEISNDGLDWENAVSCSSTCTGGDQAGKFIVIDVSRQYTPLFSGYGIIENGTMSASAATRAK
jgi:Flp pilus assembly protein TadG